MVYWLLGWSVGVTMNDSFHRLQWNCINTRDCNFLVVVRAIFFLWFGSECTALCALRDTPVLIAISRS